jgi:hypothetical protein
MDAPGRQRRIAALRRRLFQQPRTEPIAPNQRLLYRIGAVCIGAIGLLYFAGAVMSIALGPAPSANVDYLQALADRPVLARLNFAAFSAVDFLLVPAALVLYQALRQSSRRLLVVAGALFAVNLVVDFGVTELRSFALVDYAEQYAAAATGAGRTAVLTAAASARAVLPVATLLSFVVSSIGYLLVAIGSWRAVFRRAIAVVGIIGSLEGIAAGFYIFVPVLAMFMTPSLVTVGLWAIFVAIRLFRLSIGASTARIGFRRHAPATGSTR